MRDRRAADAARGTHVAGAARLLLMDDMSLRYMHDNLTTRQATDKRSFAATDDLLRL
jgi:hypothetical protein